jgi:2-methylcitrate dehydratase PrpD
MAVGFFDRKAGFSQFTEARIHDPAVLALAGKIRYVIDPDNEYPSNFTGHLRATLNDGTFQEVRQPHMRGGAREPLSRAELAAKFTDNAQHGGWSIALADEARVWCETVFNEPALGAIAQFRQ